MADENDFTFGPFRLEASSGSLWREGQIQKLTLKAFAVLCCLVERAGQVVSKEELFRVVWPDTVVSEAALTVCIWELRQALGDQAKSPRYIETVHRRSCITQLSLCYRERHAQTCVPDETADLGLSNQYSEPLQDHPHTCCNTRRRKFLGMPHQHHSIPCAVARASAR